MQANLVQNILSRYTAYSRSGSRLFSARLSSDLIIESSFQAVNNLNSIQIGLDFYSDKSVWQYVGESKVGDFKIENIGSESNKSSYSKNKRFESKEASTSHKIRCIADETYPNGFYPNMIYIGNHNLEFYDYVLFKAFQDDTFTTQIYSQKIRFSENDTHYTNSYQFAKYKYYELEFVFNAPKRLRVGRIILAGSLPTLPINNAQSGITMGWTHHKDQIMTESKTQLFNTQFFAKKLNFKIKINLSQTKLANQIEKLILEGTGSRPFLCQLYPKDPNYQSLYGILTSESEFEHNQKDEGEYTFDIEEIQ